MEDSRPNVYAGELEVRPPAAPTTRDRTPRGDRLVDVFPTARLATLAASQAILLNAIDRVHSRARNMDPWFNVIAAGSEFSADSVKELDEVGFVVIPGPVAPPQLSRLRAVYDAAVSAADPADFNSGRTTTRVSDFVNRAPDFDVLYSGGMVICDRPIADVCPVEWARMENRSVLQWDKDDCAAIGLVKFDLLGLGMLSALHYVIDLVAEHKGIQVDLAKLDLSEHAVYEMLQRADSVGVFQVESRAQMATLPRLKPRVFYDLVVEVALIRPGPIQGGSVHPFIKRRNGEDPVTYDHPSMESALRKTLGVPLFQEQLMQLAVDCAGFSAAEADQLRRAMGSKRSTERMRRLRGRFYDGMRERHGITGEVADRIYEKLEAFANFGFPESHSLSFASLVFYSSWFKLHHPAAFCAALLRAQPMGFYSPQSLVADARRHGVTVHGPDVNASLAHATLENQGQQVRLGLGSVRHIGDELAEQMVDERKANGPFASLLDLTGRVQLSVPQTEALATAWCVGLLRHYPAGGAVGGRCGSHPAPRPAAGSGVVIAHPVAARHDRTRAGRRRRVGDRYLTGQLSDSVPEGGPGRDGGGPGGQAVGGARWNPGAGGRSGDASAAARDRTGCHVHQPRGRDRDGQHPVFARGLVAAPAGWRRRRRRC